MARCRYCKAKVSYLADSCPKCGCPNPASTPYIPSSADSDEGLYQLGVVGAVIGFFIGIYYGFVWHGIGGAVLGAFVGAISGAIIIVMAIYFLAFAITIGIFAGVIWLFMQIWDLGKP